MKRGSRGARRAAVAALAVAAVPVLAGCNTSPDSAAIVGGARISISTLQSEVNAAFADPQVAAALDPSSQFSQGLGGSRAGYVRLVLGRLISDRLLTDLAAEHHVSVSAKDVSDQTQQFVQQAGSLQSLQQQAAESVGVTPAQLPSLIRLTVLQQRLSAALVDALPATPQQLRQAYQQNIDQFDTLDVSQIAVSQKALANRILAQVRRNPARFGALAARYSLDTSSSGNGGEVGQVGRKEIISLLGGVAKATPGSIALAHANGVYSVIRVNSRHIVPLSEATTQLKQVIYSGQATTLLQSALAKEGDQLGVHVSPRYGKWDASTQTVVAKQSPTSAGS